MQKNNKRFISFVIFFLLIWHMTDHSGPIQHIINVLLRDRTTLFFFCIRVVTTHSGKQASCLKKSWHGKFWLTYIRLHILLYIEIHDTVCLILPLVHDLQNLQACMSSLYGMLVHFFSKNNGFQKEWKCATFMMIDTNRLSSSLNMHQGWISCSFKSAKLKSYKRHKMHFLPRSKLAVELILMVGISF